MANFPDKVPWKDLKGHMPKLGRFCFTSSRKEGLLNDNETGRTKLAQCLKDIIWCVTLSKERGRWQNRASYHRGEDILHDRGAYAANENIHCIKVV